jgi:hypothetical protein
MNTDRYQTRSWPLRAAALLLACALCACLGLRVAAQAGSLTVTMRTDPSDPASTPVPGGTLTAYYVAELTETEKTADAESELVYKFTGGFAALGQNENENENESSGSSQSGITLPQPQQAESLNDAANLAAQLAAYAQANGVEGTTVAVDENGAATFNDLDNGLYLLVQNTAPSGYQTLRPFLVEVPTMQAAGLLFDLQAYPKLAVVTDTNEDDDDPDTPWWLLLLPLIGVPFIGGDDDTESGTVVQTPAEAEIPAPEEETGTGEGTVNDEPANAVLPQTGQLNWPVPVLALAGLSLVLLGAALRRSGKDEEE